MSGCYGLELRGLSRADGVLGPVASGAPVLTVDLCSPAVDVRDERVTPDEAVFRLQGGGSAVVDRVTGTATLRMDGAERVPHEQVVHPFLSTSAAVMNRWHGRDVFHAGAFVTKGGAWGVLGDKGQGKSTLLALMALSGHEVLSDDLLAISEGEALRGPRCIDLRGDAATELRQGEDLGVVGMRHRARLRLGEASSAVPLRGWVTLEWGGATDIGHVPVRDRLPVLLRNQALRLLPPSLPTILGLASLPFLCLTRPRQWLSAQESVDALVDAAGRAQRP